MTGRRAIIGLCMLSALLVSAFAAQSASAQTTAFTCEPVATGGAETKGFKDAHCKEATTGTSVAFEHKTIAANTTTEITGSNTTTGAGTEPTLLHSVQSGVELELKATEVTGTGSMENITEGEIMSAHGKGKITYKGLSVVKPEGKGCKPVLTEYTTTELTAKTDEAMGLTFKPAAGETFITFNIEGCTIAALNGAYEVKGSITSSSIEGATTKFNRTQTTEQKTLKLRGQNAGLSGLLTIIGKDPKIAEDKYKPLSVTTPADYV